MTSGIDPNMNDNTLLAIAQAGDVARAREAFTILWMRYCRQLRRIIAHLIMHLTGYRNPDIVEEVMGFTAVALWSALRSSGGGTTQAPQHDLSSTDEDARIVLRPEKSYLAYLRVAAKHQTLKYLERKSHRSNEVRISEEHLDVPDHGDSQGEWLWFVVGHLSGKSRASPNLARALGVSTDVLDEVRKKLDRQDRSHPETPVERALAQLSELDRDCFVLRWVADLQPREIAEIVRRVPGQVSTRLNQAKQKLAKGLPDFGRFMGEEGDLNA